EGQPYLLVAAQSLPKVADQPLHLQLRHFVAGVDVQADRQRAGERDEGEALGEALDARRLWTQRGGVEVDGVLGHGLGEGGGGEGRAGRRSVSHSPERGRDGTLPRGKLRAVAATCPRRTSPPRPASATRVSSVITSSASSASRRDSSAHPQESPNSPQFPPRS